MIDEVTNISSSPIHEPYTCALSPRAQINPETNYHQALSTLSTFTDPPKRCDSKSYQYSNDMDERK